MFSGKSEIVSEQDFVDKVLRRLKGQGGISLNSFLQNDIEWEAYNNSSFIVKVQQRYFLSSSLFIMIKYTILISFNK